MSIDAKQLREQIIRPALQEIGMWSEAAENLLMGTAAQESALGTYIVQKQGPALGIFQCEPATHNDVVARVMRNTPKYAAVVQELGVADARRLVHDLRYATIICRMHYMLVPKPLPEAYDLQGMALYWKKYYNTINGAGTIHEFVTNYNNYVM